MNIRDSLKSMLNNMINDNPEQASMDLHNYFTVKMRDIAGLSTAPVQEPSTDVTPNEDGSNPSDPDLGV